MEQIEKLSIEKNDDCDIKTKKPEDFQNKMKILKKEIKENKNILHTYTAPGITNLYKEKDDLLFEKKAGLIDEEKVEKEKQKQLKYLDTSGFINILNLKTIKLKNLSPPFILPFVVKRIIFNDKQNNDESDDKNDEWRKINEESDEESDE